MTMAVIKLTTLQSPLVWSMLEQNKQVHADSFFSDLPEFHGSYEWMKGQARDKIEAPRQGGKDLFWAWAKFNGKFAPLDMRAFKVWKRPFVRIDLEVPSSSVLMSDFDGWHHVLNNISCDSDDDNEPQEAIERSWQKIFDLTTAGLSIQGVMWEIRLDWVKRCTLLK